MGQRSRKRARRSAPATPPAAPTRPSPAPAPGGPPPGERTGRGEARNAAVRERLRPLRPGERPGAVTVAALITTVLAGGNVILYAVGFKVHGQPPTFRGIAVLSVLLGACSYGLWRARYWGVLGFQALLSLTILFAGISLPLSRGLKGVAICLGILVPGGFLFYKLVRAMARIQMPERRRRG